jgi:hypothetical protein
MALLLPEELVGKSPLGTVDLGPPEGGWRLPPRDSIPAPTGWEAKKKNVLENLARIPGAIFPQNKVDAAMMPLQGALLGMGTPQGMMIPRVSKQEALDQVLTRHDIWMPHEPIFEVRGGKWTHTGLIGDRGINQVPSQAQISELHDPTWKAIQKIPAKVWEHVRSITQGHSDADDWANFHSSAWWSPGSKQIVIDPATYFRSADSHLGLPTITAHEAGHAGISLARDLVEKPDKIDLSTLRHGIDSGILEPYHTQSGPKQIYQYHPEERLVETYAESIAKPVSDLDEARGYGRAIEGYPRPYPTKARLNKLLKLYELLGIAE